MNHIDWGLIDYDQAVQMQLELVDQVASRQTSDTIVTCTHPPVVTLGRATQEQDVFGWDGPTVSVSRGGRATYHGPSQIVIYPILDLREERRRLMARDIVGYLRLLEEATCEVVREYGLSAEGKLSMAADPDHPDLERTGVWVNGRKLVSIGIAVRKWVTYHGLALNFDRDEQAFRGMNPCGYSSDVMTSLEAELSRKVDRETFQAQMVHRISTFFS